MDILKPPNFQLAKRLLFVYGAAMGWGAQLAENWGESICPLADRLFCMFLWHLPIHITDNCRHTSTTTTAGTWSLAAINMNLTRVSSAGWKVVWNNLKIKGSNESKSYQISNTNITVFVGGAFLEYVKGHTSTLARGKLRLEWLQLIWEWLQLVWSPLQHCAAQWCCCRKTVDFLKTCWSCNGVKTIWMSYAPCQQSHWYSFVHSCSRPTAQHGIDPNQKCWVQYQESLVVDEYCSTSTRATTFVGVAS
jgi:hypothetical protein